MDNIYYSKCLICGCENPEPSHFWKNHHIKESEYCYTYLPRYSKLTGNLIEFKSRDFYFDNDFNSKIELKKWVNDNKDIALDYCLSVIKKRKDARKATYVLSEVELEILKLPKVPWFDTQCNYNLRCENIGLIRRFDYSIINPSFNNQDFTIFCDTREQLPWKFNKSIIKTLNYGDYHCEESKWNDIFIERKGLSDFLSSVGANNERLRREIERAAKNNHYLIFLVEEELQKALSFNYLPHISRKIKASPEFIFKRTRDLIQDYKNIQFVFLKRVDCPKFVQKIYNCIEDPKNIDWELNQKTILKNVISGL